MEQQEIEIERKRRKSASSSLPMDLISEILLKLPAKSVTRFGCVSKPWSSITTDPYFTNRFETSQQINLLLFFKKGGKFFVFSIPQQQHNNQNSNQPIDGYSIIFPKYCNFTIKTESVHGLICFQNPTHPIIWNPTLRKFSTLTKPKKGWKVITVFLGYDPIEGKHKVLCFPYSEVESETFDEGRVLTLGSSSQESWRSVKTNHKHHPFTSGRHTGGIYGRCINGVLYYQATVENSVRVLMSFDVRSEKFDLIVIPSSWGTKLWSMKAYKGSLAFVKEDNGITMWVLDDAKKREWSKHVFPPDPEYDKPWKNTFKLIGFTDDGELIYVPKTLRKSSIDILYVDPKRGTSREVTYRGIADDELRRNNGLGNKRISGLQYFPYHIETLLSF